MSIRLRKDRQQFLMRALRDGRLDAGLRQVDVAEALGRPQSYVAKIESGERSVDFIEVLDICRVIRLDPVQLVEALR